jgi:hypothetical protein
LDDPFSESVRQVALGNCWGSDSVVKSFEALVTLAKDNVDHFILCRHAMMKALQNVSVFIAILEVPLDLPEVPLDLSPMHDHLEVNIDMYNQSA